MFTYLRSGLVGISGSIVSSSTHQCCSVFVWFDACSCCDFTRCSLEVVQPQLILFERWSPCRHCELFHLGCSPLCHMVVRIDQSWCHFGSRLINPYRLFFSSHHSHPGFFRGGGIPTFCQCERTSSDHASGFSGVMVEISLLWSQAVSPDACGERVSISRSRWFAPWGNVFDRADALLIDFRFVISLLSGRFARSAFKEVSFRADQMHCSLDFHFVIWHYPGWSASCQIQYPKSTHVSRGQKQRSAALWGEHVITCVLQELWLGHIYIYIHIRI